MQSLTRPLLVVTLLLMGNAETFAQAAGETSRFDELRATVEALRSKANDSRTRIFNEDMQLAPKEAEKFWAVYHQYEKERAALYDRKLAFLREYCEHLDKGTLEDPAADRLAQEWLNILQARLDLWKKYQKKIARATSPSRALQFLHVEHETTVSFDSRVSALIGPLRIVSKPAKN